MQKDAPTEDLFASMLLAADVRQLLKRHGVRAQVELVDENGDALSAEVRQTLVSDLGSALQKGEHTRKLATVGGLAAGVTHEARNLLTGVVGFAHVLLAKTPEGEARDMLKLIDTEARRCVELLSSYLKLSRSGAETTRFLNVSEIVQPIERLVSYQLRERNCTLAVSIQDDLPRVLGSCGELQRVLINLVLNAADATGDGGHVYVRAGCDDGQSVQISVTDDGPGVPDELRERIFEAFFSTKAVGDGTGLGLALSRRIVEAHRGVLVLEPDRGLGTTFTVQLPVAKETAGKR